ncbi:MAG: HyaD/HybD family hydrogenase maturation endopeptidase [Deferribacteraceae bacterium]|jgi:hydrogenase maturation protease|nr:HyaD/HybD family hydrogenase maturation endopeptidase [Deferribacteraceae bacterium]
MKQIVIMGIGNLLLTDEGIGVHAAKELAKRELPANVSVYDAGTLGLLSAYMYEGSDLLILIDAVDTQGEPGQVFRYCKDDIMLNRIPVKLSPHQIGFQETLLVSELRGQCPAEVIFFGAIPASLDPSVELSAKGKKALEEILKEVDKLLTTI